MLRRIIYLIAALLCVISTTACDKHPWNNPHPKQDKDSNYFYSVFTESPKTLDPARSYAANEAIFTAQVYEPPLQYHYLKRPYALAPLTAKSVPEPEYYDKHNNRLPADAAADQVAYSIYDIYIKPGIMYQPHPAFAKDEQGHYLYHDLSSAQLKNINKLSDFTQQGTRELTAADYVYQIKRLASPKVQSPIKGLMQAHIVGLADYEKQLDAQQANGQFLDLRNFDLAGVKVIDDEHFQVKVKGKYPQFKYWLAMPFFAPIPWEADRFYSQPGLQKKNISFDWYPVGTGPYMLTKNNPNRQMVLSRNPNFHGETFPSEGEPGDFAAGLLANAGKPLPFVDKFIFNLEKESIPYWNKFLQGYYDQSGISSDSFDQAITIDADGNPDLTPDIKAKGIRLTTSVEPSVFYLGFNMMDPTVGGYTEQAKKLRQALGIAVDFDEFISIFLNGRGIAAQSPLPPGIFGNREGEDGINPYVYQWRNGHPQRKSLAYAKQLLAEAGYPNGINSKTGKPLVINYEAVGGGGPDERARFDWMRKQFAKLGVQLHVRATQYNRFQDKLRTGNAQVFLFGWNADYPDPENFLFLFYGPNGKVKYSGENVVNYVNPEYDRLFLQMKDMPNGEARQKVIDKMLAILRQDSPMLWGFYPKIFVLYHDWNQKRKSNAMARNHLKYINIDAKTRQQKRHAWNQPTYWPILVGLLIIVAILVPVIIGYRKKLLSKRKRV